MSIKFVEDIDWFDDESDFDDNEVRKGVVFYTDGDEYEWLESESDIVHLDFDRWQVWSAFNDSADIVYFVVDIDTGFIDWGPCDTVEEAREFLDGKIEDYQLDESIEIDPIEDNDIVEDLDDFDECTNPGDISNAPAKHVRMFKDLDKKDESVKTEGCAIIDQFSKIMKDINKYSGIVMNNIEGDGDKDIIINSSIIKLSGMIDQLIQIKNARND